jgi:hypothetical protein
MPLEREPLHRWHYPRDVVLNNRVFASGRPPFAPYPTVTNLMNANHCPVALWHDYMHGIDSALMGQFQYQKRGEYFHRFISFLKLSLKNRSLQLRGAVNAQLQTIQNTYSQFARSQGLKMGESMDLWNDHIEPWVVRKLQNDELQNITPDNQLFFEITVSNPRFGLALQGGERHYPIKGVIDEIDFTNRRIIERTIKGTRIDQEPPLLKDYQLWLEWKALCSLRQNQLPPLWQNFNFDDFTLIVETPHRDFIVKDIPILIDQTHWAYAWIADMSVSESPEIFSEVFDNANCAPENPDERCQHPFINCFPRRFPFPRSRPEIRQTFYPWYRLLLWEQMWKRDLWNYQITMLNRQDLINLGFILETHVCGSHGNQVELETLAANSLRDYSYCTIIPFGTIFCGLQLKARVTRTQQNRLFLNIHGILPALSEEALLMMSPDIPAPVMQEPVVHLDRQTQGALFRLYNIGVATEEKSHTRSVLQLLEAIFGTRGMRRERQ